ncbi:ATP-binding protein [Candidatus Peregrinibacteria bacterium]|nr:ATP-binding protein [Candidatus Peregrinibacteria bacterium]
MSIVRDVTREAIKHLESEEILIFVGSRQSGKTTILKQIQTEIIDKKQPSFFLNLEDPEYLDLLNEHPRNLLKIFSLNPQRKNFVFIDEIQYLKNPSNFLKYIFDEYKGKIKLIVSGSSAFYMDRKFTDSLAGRKRIFNVYTLSFREFLRFKEENELSEKNFNNVSMEEENKIDLYFREFVVFGGYPRVVLSPLDEKENILRELAYSYVKKDIFEANIKQEDVFYKFFKILASQTGGLVNASGMAGTLGVSKTSIDNYLYVMRKSFHVALIPPFFRNIRKEISKMPKVFFYDMGLRNFFLGNFSSFETRTDKGQLLENAVFKQLLERDGVENVRFWRTASQKEVDFVSAESSAYEVKSDIGQFKRSKYKDFIRAYPKINFSIATLGTPKKSIEGYPVLNVWRI